MSAPAAAVDAPSRRSSALFITTSVLALLAIGLHWAQPPTVVAQIDLPPPFGIGDMLRKCAFAWGAVHTYYGSIDNCSSWYPYWLVLAGLDTVFGPSYGQALVFISTVICSWLGAFALARAVGCTPPAAFVGAWVYAFNPARQIMFGEFATGEVCAALLPWALYWIVVASREPARRPRARAWLAVLAFAPLSVLAATPQLLVALVLSALLAVSIATLLWTSDARSFLRWIGGTVLLALATSAWWTVPNILSYAGASIVHPVSPATVAWTFDRASLLNELRFCAAWVWQYAEYNPWAIAFDRTPSLYASGFIVVALLIVALIVCRGRSLAAARWFGGVALCALFLAKGLHPPLDAVNAWFYSLPGMFLFIEPYGLVLLAAIALGVCAALAIDALARGSAGVRRAMPAVATLSVAALLWNNAATITGAIFHEKTNLTPGEHIALPAEWTAAAAYLNDSRAPGGVVVLPPDDHYQADYSWGYRGVDMLAIELIGRAVLMPGPPFWYTQPPAAAAMNDAIVRLFTERSSQLRDVLLRSGVRFALVRDDVHPVADGVAPHPMNAAGLFGRPAAVFGAIQIYDLGSPAPVVARITIATDAGASTGVFASALATDAWSEQHGVAIGAGLDRLAALGRTAYVPLPSLVGRSPDGPLVMHFDVMNPSRAPMIVDLRLGVWPRTRTTYALVEGTMPAGTVSADPSPVAEWCAFPGVRLLPGMNHLAFVKRDASAARWYAFMPPRYDARQPWQPHIDELVLTVRRSAEAAPIRTAGMRLDIPLTDEPTVTMRSQVPGGAAIWASIGFSAGERHVVCDAIFHVGEERSLAAVGRDCFAGVGETLDAAMARSMHVDAIAPFAADDGPLPRDLSIDVRALPRTAGPAFMATDPLAPPAKSLADVSGLGGYVPDTGDGDAPLVLRQSFSSTWMAIDLSDHTLMRHEVAFGWSNGWQCPPHARVLVVNWLSALVLLLLPTCAVVTAVWWWRP